MNPPTQLADPYVEYSALLRRLHRLIARGADESAEGDDVRDLMDEPWYAMNDEQRRLVGELTLDLFTISDPGRFERVDLESEDWTNRYRNGLAQEDWIGLLELIRTSPGPMSRAEAMAARARWWYQLGDRESALVFAEEAVPLLGAAPAGAAWANAVLRSHILDELGQEAEAIDRLVAFAEASPDAVPQNLRDRFQRAAEDRRSLRQLVREATVPAA